MSYVQFNELSKENKTTLSILNQLQPIKATSEILSIHRYFLNNIKSVSKTKPNGLISPFSLFNQKKKIGTPFKISLPKPSDLIDKIGALGKPKFPENPLQDFINSLSATSKTAAVTNSPFSAQIVGVYDENKEFKTLRLKRPEGWNFLPGQYLEIRSENSSATKPAILAIASAVGDDYIEITAKPNANPNHANYCLNSGVGEYLTVTGPMGTNFPTNLITPNTPVLVLGGGSGLTALKSLMESMPLGTDPKLIYSSKTAQELLYHEDIAKWKAEGHTISLTQETVDGFEHGRITDHLAHMDIKPNTLVFLCGPKELVIETAKFLASMGVPRELIYGSLPATAKDGGPVYRGDHPKMLS